MSNAGPPVVHWGSWCRNLAVFATIVLLMLVAFASVQGSMLAPVQNSKSAQLKEQLLVVPTCNYENENVCPALALFHNPEFHEVATENLMSVSLGLIKTYERNIL